MNTISEIRTAADVPTDRETDLPEGWTVAELPLVADIAMGQSPPGSTYNDQQKGLPFFQGKADFGDRSPTVRVWCTSPKKVARPGDILLSVRAPVGPTNVATEVCAIGRGLSAITPLGGIPTEFILFALRLQEPELALSGTGSTFTAMSRKDLDEIAINLAPLAEQKRIVAKIKELFKQVFRQSVLAAACSGRLTEDWRESQAIPESSQQFIRRICELRRQAWQEKKLDRVRRTYPNPDEVDTTDLPDLPESWEWASADAVCSQITDGEHIQPPYESEGRPMLSAKHVRDGFVTLEGAGLISEPDFRKALERCQPEEGNILIVSVGAKTGRSALVENCLPFAIVRSVLLLKPLIPARFFLRWVQSPWCFSWMTQASGASAQPHLYIKDTKRMPVPIPPLPEQYEIVRRVEALFKIADKIEKRVEAATNRADKLIQAILAKAFRGELVPTEAELARREGCDYEPASVLLERIRTEREKSATTKSDAKRPRRSKPRDE